MYEDEVKKYVSCFNDNVKLDEIKFFSCDNMKTIAHTLETMHISQFGKDDKSEGACLHEIAKKTQELRPEAPADCRNDRYRKRMLYSATSGGDWAVYISSSSSFANLSYRQGLHKLQNEAQQYFFHAKHSEDSDSMF